MKKVNLFEFADLLEWGVDKDKATWNELCNQLDDVHDSIAHESSHTEITIDELQDEEEKIYDDYSREFLLEFMKDHKIKKFTLVR